MLDFTGPILVDSCGFLQEWGGHCKVLTDSKNGVVLLRLFGFWKEQINSSLRVSRSVWQV